MVESKYKVYLYNMSSREIFAELSPSSIAYDYELDEAGSATISFPTDSLKLDGTQLKANDIYPVRTGVAIGRGSELVWGGLLWQYKVDLSAGMVTLDAGGYLSYYKYRHTPTRGKRMKTQILNIVRWFLLECNDNNGINTNLSELVDNWAVRYKVWAPYEYVTIADVMADMADETSSKDDPTLPWWALGGGFFFYFDPYFVTSKQIGNRIWNTLSRIPSYQGVSLVQGQNCEIGEISVDGTALTNKVFMVGANGKKDIPIHYETRERMWASRGTPRLELVVSDTSEKSREALVKRANAELGYGANPVTLPTAVTYPNMFSPTEVRPGTLVKVTVDDDFIGLTEADYVVTKVSVDVTADGSDRLTLDMVQEELFKEVDVIDG